jgi:hypothetical protein
MRRNYARLDACEPVSLAAADDGAIASAAAAVGEIGESAAHACRP